MTKVMIQILFFLMAIRIGDILIEILKKSLEIHLESEKDCDEGIKRKPSLSVAVGYLERALVYILVINGSIEAIGWLFAAKSIARFKELENRAFTEYYLIGTLASILWAIICAISAKWLITFTNV